MQRDAAIISGTLALIIVTARLTTLSVGLALWFLWITGTMMYCITLAPRD